MRNIGVFAKCIADPVGEIWISPAAFRRYRRLVVLTPPMGVAKLRGAPCEFPGAGKASIWPLYVLTVNLRFGRSPIYFIASYAAARPSAPIRKKRARAHTEPYKNGGKTPTARNN